MGIWTFLNPLNWFRRRRGDERDTGATPRAAAPEARAKTEAPPARKTASGTAKTAPRTTATATKPAAKTATRKTTAKAATPRAPSKTATATRHNPRCAAVTAAGTPCKRAARDGSKYCAGHKGYRAPAKKTAKTPAPRRTAPKTAAKTTGARKAPTKAPAKAADGKAKAQANGAAKTTRRVHVAHNGYKLYRKGNRFYFSKKSQAEVRGDGAEPVYELPKDREVKVTQNGLPVLKSK